MAGLAARSIASTLAVVAAIGLALAWTRHRQPQASPPVERATFVGAEACASCHRLEAERWRESNHAHAMEKPSSATVKAPFAGETFSLRDETTTFSQRDGRYRIRTDGPGGVVGDFDVAYTFGTSPLQQYLVAMPGGRLQSLGIAWDARPAPAGQRWYHLYADAPPPSGDVLHWTGRAQNWNFMCADCHSTNVRKNYVAAD